MDHPQLVILSVFTAVDRDELAAWLAPLGLGELIAHAGIAAGTQNSNYFVTTGSGDYVLTVFERVDAAALDFYLALQDHLARQGLPVPRPLPDAAGRYRRELAGKPAALLSRLPGANVDTPDAGHCRAVGDLLARLHLAARDFPDALPNPCGAAWRQATGKALLPLLTPTEQALLRDELAFQTAQDGSALPQGIIHADLFRDNILWDTGPDGCGRLSGVLDFYFAGVDAWLFDLAVAANDWCADADNLGALLTGYTARRPLVEAERTAWAAMRRAAALRFWLLRLDARHRPRPGAVVTTKDPEHFRCLLERFRLAPEALPR